MAGAQHEYFVLRGLPLIPYLFGFANEFGLTSIANISLADRES